MRTCSSKKIGYSSSGAAVTALLEMHRKSVFSPGEGPQNVYRCHICDQYHMTSRGPAIPELQQKISVHSDKTQNDITYWVNKFKDY